MTLKFVLIIILNSQVQMVGNFGDKDLCEAAFVEIQKQLPEAKHTCVVQEVVVY